MAAKPGRVSDAEAIAPEAGGREDLKGTTYELFILAISILSIVNLVLLAALPWQSQSWYLVIYIDTALTVIFLADFSYRMATASSKRHYLGRGGGALDLVSCVPALRIFRLFRIVRAVRIIRRLGGARMLRELRGSLAPARSTSSFLSASSCSRWSGYWSSTSRRTPARRTSRPAATRCGGATSPPPRSATATTTR